MTKCGTPTAPTEGYGCPASTTLKEDAVYPKIESGVAIEGDSFLKNVVTMAPG